MSPKHEQGFILPVAIAILSIITFVVYLLLSHSIRNRQTSLLNQELIRVFYAAESGIAMMQYQLWKHKHPNTISTVLDGIQLKVYVQKQSSSWIITAIAQGKWEVKRTLKVGIDPKTLVFRRWIE